MIITIDGPAGSGKSTAARNLAKRLGIAYLDTGATYRAVTLKAMREGVSLEDEQALAATARAADIQLVADPSGLRVILDGQDVSREIRTAEVSEKSYYVARSGVVREVLVGLQKRLGTQVGDFVTEGRDQGTVVFPQARFKFYLDASPEVRARRRCAEMSAAGEPSIYPEVLRAILQRDYRDSSRTVAPLVQPPDSVRVDTSNRTIEETTAELLRIVEAGRT